MNLSPALPRAAMFAIAALLALPGCGTSPESITGATTARNAPGSSTDGVPPHLWDVFDRGRSRILPGRSFTYPLEPGRAMRYGVTMRMGAVTDSVPDWGPWYRFERTREITCRVSLNGHDYMTERWTHDIAGTNWLLLRQDRRGLYEADGFLYDPPPCEAVAAARAAGDREAAEWLALSYQALAARPDAGRNATAWQAAWAPHIERASRILEGMGRGPLPGAGIAGIPGPPEGELLRLSYPLRPGRRWVVRQDPRFESTVERIEFISLPAGRMFGARIRLTSELYPGGADVLEWYGPEGFLRLTARFVEEVTDEYGNVIGAYVSEMEERLEAIERRPRP